MNEADDEHFEHRPFPIQFGFEDDLYTNRLQAEHDALMAKQTPKQMREAARRTKEFMWREKRRN